MEPTEEKFHIKVSWKNKANYDMKGWQEKMLTYNGENADEHSQLISSYGDVSDVYSICENPAKMPVFTMNRDKMGSHKDFASKIWDQNKLEKFAVLARAMLVVQVWLLLRITALRLK